MSTVEARTREALHEVLNGLSVTDDDVVRMEAELLTALANPPHPGIARLVGSRRRRWGLAAAAVATAVAVAGGIALSGDRREQRVRPAGAPASDQPIVPSDLVGTWRAGSYVWTFVADGRTTLNVNASGYLEGDFDGRILARSGDVYSVRTVDGCDETVRIREVRPGAVALSGQKTSCDPSQGPETEERILERISPDPYLGDRLSTPAPTPGPTGLQEPSSIDGFWLHVETGTLLAVGTPWGGSVLTYVLDDDGDGKIDPDQRGRVTVPEAGPPVFRPDATDRETCELKFSSAVILHARMTTTSPAGGCLPAGGPQNWVRIL